MLAVHGAFDGSTAWALRIEMAESPAREFVVDLSCAVEACDFAAGVIAAWARRWGRVKRVRFRPGTPEPARVLDAHGLELVPDPADAPLPVGLPPRRPAADPGVSA